MIQCIDMEQRIARSRPGRVLIVGGGLVGLSAAVCLAWRDVPVVLVERHAGSSLHPRAIGFTTRTTEIYRAVGLGSRIPQAPRNPLGIAGSRPRRVKAESLAGKWLEETNWTPNARSSPVVEVSPCTGTALTQDRLEPILRERATELGADIRLETELVSFDQDDAGVTATLRGRDPTEYPLRADFLVAADGHRSRIREALGIGRQGRGHIVTGRSVLFRAPLEKYLEAGVVQFEIEQGDFKAFLTTYKDGRWVLMGLSDEERDDDTLRALVTRAIGRSDLAIEIITTGRWEVSALIADRFSSGRVFLAGDAAHTLPPARGGYGANTGIEDAHNLAWKLDAVLSGTSTMELLETYDAERRPIAWLRHNQIFARPDFERVAGVTAAKVPIIDDEAMELGQLYRSTAVLGAGDELPPALRPEQWAGQPGTRAPHAWLMRNEEPVSTLDLFDGNWVLLTEDERWLATAVEAERSGVVLRCVRIGGDLVPVDPAAFRAAFTFGSAGAALVRPDGYVAWRTTVFPANAVDTLTASVVKVASATAPGVGRHGPGKSDCQ
jgi:putative polyketide hydroxylase